MKIAWAKVKWLDINVTDSIIVADCEIVGEIFHFGIIRFCGFIAVTRRYF